MATVQFGDHGGDLSNPSVHSGGQYTVFTATNLEQQTTDGWRFTATGENLLSQSGAYLTSYSGYVPDGSLAFSISGIHTDLSLFQAYVSSGNMYALVTLIASGNDTVTGGAGNDTARGGAGNDTFDGRGGVDTAVYEGNRSAYTVTRTALDAWRVAGTADGTDSLVGVERLKFADKSVAFDLSGSGHAAQAVELLGAAFGTSALTDRVVVGIALGLFDAGFSMHDVCSVVVGLPLFQSLASSSSNVSFVEYVYRNLTSNLPSTVDRDLLVGLLQGSGGSMSQADMLEAAALCQPNVDHIGLTGMQAMGIEYV